MNNKTCTEHKNNPFIVTKEEYEQQMAGLRGCFKIVAISAITTIVLCMSALIMIRKHHNNKKVANNTSCVNSEQIATLNNKTFAIFNEKQK